MKKLLTVSGIILLVGALAYPVFARGPGWGGGCPGWNTGGGPGYCWRDQGPATNLTPEQQNQLNSMDQKFHNETATLRNNIWTRQNEMSILLNGDNPDPVKLRALQKEINQLKAEMSEKRLAYRLETRKVAPDRSTYGRGYGKGRGGYGGGGYGSGRCWN